MSEERSCPLLGVLGPVQQPINRTPAVRSYRDIPTCAPHGRPCYDGTSHTRAASVALANAYFLQPCLVSAVLEPPLIGCYPGTAEK